MQLNYKLLMRRRRKNMEKKLLVHLSNEQVIEIAPRKHSWRCTGFVNRRQWFKSTAGLQILGVWQSGNAPDCKSGSSRNRWFKSIHAHHWIPLGKHSWRCTGLVSRRRGFKSLTQLHISCNDRACLTRSHPFATLIAMYLGRAR